jgi:hypothetical protein
MPLTFRQLKMHLTKAGISNSLSRFVESRIRQNYRLADKPFRDPAMRGTADKCKAQLLEAKRKGALKY